MAKGTGKRVDIVMKNGQRRRATAEVEDGRVVLHLAGVTLTASDYAMHGARVIVGDESIVRGLKQAGYDAVLPDKATVTAKLSPAVSQALAAACSELGISTATAVAYAVEAWLEGGHPFPVEKLRA